MEENKRVMHEIDDNFGKSIKLKLEDIDNLAKLLKKNYKEISCTIAFSKKDKYELQSIDLLEDEIIRYSKDISSIDILAKEDDEELNIKLNTNMTAKQTAIFTGKTHSFQKKQDVYKYFNDIIKNNKLLYDVVRVGLKFFYGIAITLILFYVNEVYFEYNLLVYSVVVAICTVFLASLINPIIEHKKILPRIQFWLDEHEIEEKKRQNIRFTIISSFVLILLYVFLFTLIRKV